MPKLAVATEKGPKLSIDNTLKLPKIAVQMYHTRFQNVKYFVYQYYRARSIVASSLHALSQIVSMALIITPFESNI